MREFSKDSYMKLISHITYFVMRNQGVRRIILYRTLFKLTFAQKTKVIDSNYGRANTNFSHLGKECTGYQTYRSAVHPMSPNLQMECRYGGLGKSVENRMSGESPRLKYQRHYAPSTFMRRNWNEGAMRPLINSPSTFFIFTLQSLIPSVCLLFHKSCDIREVP